MDEQLHNETKPDTDITYSSDDSKIILDPKTGKITSANSHMAALVKLGIKGNEGIYLQRQTNFEETGKELYLMSKTPPDILAVLGKALLKAGEPEDMVIIYWQSSEKEGEKPKRIDTTVAELSTSESQ